MNSLLATTLLTAGAVAAASGDKPTRIVPRATSICGQWDSVETGAYTIYQDLWNEASGTGSQCTTVDSVTDDGVLAWSTSWSWTGNSSQVKSFANTVTNTSIVTLADISAIPSVWSWSYTGTDIVADVAYDLFTSSSATGSDEYEVMIWLDALGGAGPISSTGSAVATTPELAGTTWDLYSGLNGEMTVFSFVATAAVSDFDGDLLDFLQYLVDDQGMPDSQYLLSIGAGSEPFTGTSAVFSVASFSAGLSTGAVVATAATTTTSSSSAVVAATTTSAEAISTSVEASATPTTFVVQTTTPTSSSNSSASSSNVVVPASSSSLATAKKPCASRHAQPSQQGVSTGFGHVTTAAPGGKAVASVAGRAATPVTTSTTAPAS